MPQARRIKATERRQKTGFWFVLPAFVVYLLFFGYPFFRTVYLSFMEWNGLGEPTFVGLANYSRLVADPLMWSSLWNNLIWVFWGTVMPISIGLVLSVILWTGVKGGIVFRTIYFLPMVLSAFVIGVIWRWIYHPLYGLLNQGLKAIGLGSLGTTGWLGETSTALYAVLAAAIWSYIGFCVVVLFSGLQKVDTELVDASRIDGANAWQRFRNIIIPQIRPVLTMVLVYTIIGGFNVFDVVWAMTEGGPANSSEVIATYTYEAAFRVREVGYGAALSMVMTVIALFAAWATLQLRKAG